MAPQQIENWLRRTVARWRPVAEWRASRTIGCVDTITGDQVAGWAWNPQNPDRPGIVEVRYEGRCLWRGSADLFRTDLQKVGIRGGFCGFSVPISIIPKSRYTQTVQIRVAGHEAPLRFKGSEDIQLRRPIFDLIAMDITNNCNLRCPFCLVDYSRIRTTELMSEQTFQQAMKLTHLVSDGMFHLSCLHEPTLHPRMAELLRMVPKDQAHQFFFTTNLARPLKDEDFEAWANSGIRRIQISIDSLDPEVYPVLRKHGRLNVFQDNLSRLVHIFRSHPKPPELHYITVAFKSNMAEAPELVRKTGELYLASRHEVRSIYDTEHISDAFRQAQYLDQASWDQLCNRLSTLPYPVVIAPRTATKEELVQVMPSANYSGRRGNEKWPGGRIEGQLALRILVDGSVVVLYHEDRWSVNLNDLADPAQFLDDMYATAWQSD